MKLYIIRHGQRADAYPDYTGGGNSPLSSVGLKQAEHVAEFMQQKEPTALYCSSMLRAIQTALPLHRRLRKTLQIWPVFCETNTDPWLKRHAENPALAENVTLWRTHLGVPELTAEEVERIEGNFYLLSSLPEKYPGAQLTQPFPWPDAWWLTEHEALQCRETGFARLELGLAALLARHSDEDRVVLVCHGNCGDMMAALLLGLPRNQSRRMITDNASIMKIEIGQQNVNRLLYANRIDHLPVELQV